MFLNDLSGNGAAPNRPTNTGEEATLSQECYIVIICSLLLYSTLHFSFLLIKITIDTTGGVNYGQQGFGFGEKANVHLEV